MAERAYWQQRSKHDVLERIEIHDAQYTNPSPELQLKGDDTGFTFRHDEVTSDSNDKLINIQANRIQIGKLDFRPRIETSQGFTLLEDIRDSDNKQFHIVYKRDGSEYWAGWVTTRIFSYPEKDLNFVAHIRATDFEILKGIDYPLDDSRQTFTTTFADLFSELPTNVPIKTATSWVEQNLDNDGNITKPYDFLNYIYHETKALREFARTGDETDQPITKWEALEHVAEPGLLIRQMGGHVMIDQLTALADPTSVNETVYDHTGTVTTATQSVDRRQTGYTTVDNGTPVVKASSQNYTYPAIKEVHNTFDHRTQVSGIQLPNEINLLDSQTEPFNQLFIGDGAQSISISFDVYAYTDINESSMDARFRVTIGSYYLQDDGSWDTVSNNYYEVALTKGKPQVGGGNVWRGSFSIRTDTIPDPADGQLDLVFAGAAGSTDFADETDYISPSFRINNPVASKDSTSVYYRLAQTGVYPTVLKIDNTYFGDGPTNFSVSALRYNTGDQQTTGDTWRCRGQTINYRNYHNNLLHEVIDMGRSNVRKLEADIWGNYDPTKILSYNGSYFYFAGGKYDGTRGRWQVTLMELDLKTGPDTFDDIPKFTDETGSGSGSTSSSSTTDQSTFDERYAKQSANASDFDDIATVRSNLGLSIGSDVQAWSTTLDDLTNNLDATADNLDTAYAQRGSQIAGNLLSWDGSDLDVNSSLNVFANNPLTASEIGQLQNINTVTISNTQWGYLGTLDQDVSQNQDVDFNSVTTQNNVTAYANNGGTSIQDANYAVNDLTINGNLFTADPNDINVNDSVFATDGTIKDKYISGGTATSLEWGNITGTLSNQTDLQSALDGKADTFSNRGTLDGISSTDVSAWDAAYNNHITGVRGSGNGTLYLDQNDGGTITTSLAHSHGSGDLPSDIVYSGDSPTFQRTTIADDQSIQGTGSTGILGSGIKVSWDTDFAFFGLKDDGSDNKNVVIANEQTSDDFLFVSKGVTQLTITGGGSISSADGTSGQWQTAYNQRGSQIAGAGLAWDGNELDFDSSYSPTFAGATFTGLTTHNGGIDSSDRIKVDVQDTTSGSMSTLAYRFGEGRGWGYNEVDNRIFYNASGSTPFWVETGNAKFNVSTTFTGLTTHEGGIESQDQIETFNTIRNHILLNDQSGSGTGHPSIAFRDNGSFDVKIGYNIGSQWIDLYDDVNDFDILRAKIGGDVEIPNGNVAINKTGATEALDVNGNAVFSGLTTHEGGIDVDGLVTLKNENAIFLQDPTASTYGGRLYFNNANSLIRLSGYSAGSLVNAINIGRDNGRVGIKTGNNAPTEALDVSGNGKFSGNVTAYAT